MVSRNEAIIAAGSESLVEFIKMIPGVNILVSGVKAYQENIDEQQRIQFIEELNSRLKELGDKFENSDWYKTDNGIEITKKIIASALNAEFADKISFFVNALINASKSFDQDERLKFIETLRIISKPALKVLAKERELQKRRGIAHSTQVLQDELIKELNLSPFLVETCITELYNLGIFSHTTEFSSSGQVKSSFSKGTAAYNEFTEKFVSFILDPRTLVSDPISI
jgi:hypothetical protein